MLCILQFPILNKKLFPFNLYAHYSIHSNFILYTIFILFLLLLFVCFTKLNLSATDTYIKIYLYTNIKALPTKEKHVLTSRKVDHKLNTKLRYFSFLSFFFYYLLVHSACCMLLVPKLKL